MAPVTRRAWLRAGGGLVLATGSLGAYAFGIEPHWRLVVRRHALTPPGWPPGSHLRLAALTDLHAGDPIMSLGRIEEIVAATNALNPDIVVLLGDYGAASRFVRRAIPHGEVAVALAGLRAPLGVHAVTGNHDWWEDGTREIRPHHVTVIARSLEGRGIGVLRNTARPLATPGGARFWLAGVESSWAYGNGRGADDLPAALRAVADEAPVILLAHEPDIFPRVPARVSLTLSGHTHGGQVRVLGHAPFVPSRFGTRYLQGHIVEEGRHLIVSAGLGCTRVPIRLGVPPEILLVELG
ncbi:MAG TPA: metallophosphoesterase [Acetobacteraceae bacterium]|nr:metallophosphoesterase [Acetobacteraceae bacterium]